MATYKMALAKGEPKRLVITAPPFKGWYREIRLDGCDIGRLETKQECLEGRTFALGDGTTLRVSIEPPSFLRGGRLRVGARRRRVPLIPGSEGAGA